MGKKDRKRLAAEHKERAKNIPTLFAKRQARNALSVAIGEYLNITQPNDISEELIKSAIQEVETGKVEVKGESRTEIFKAAVGFAKVIIKANQPLKTPYPWGFSRFQRPDFTEIEYMMRASNYCLEKDVDTSKFSLLENPPAGHKSQVSSTETCEQVIKELEDCLKLEANLDRNSSFFFLKNGLIRLKIRELNDLENTANQKVFQSLQVELLTNEEMLEKTDRQLDQVQRNIAKLKINLVENYDVHWTDQEIEKETANLEEDSNKVQYSEIAPEQLLTDNTMRKDKIAYGSTRSAEFIPDQRRTTGGAVVVEAWGITEEEPISVLESEKTQERGSLKSLNFDLQGLDLSGAITGANNKLARLIEDNVESSTAEEVAPLPTPSPAGSKGLQR